MLHINTRSFIICGNAHFVMSLHNKVDAAQVERLLRHGLCEIA